MTVKRKLNAIGYTTNDPNLTDENEFRKIIHWLETNKIKKGSADVRKELGNFNSTGWTKCFENYKKTTACPINDDKNKEALLDWFVGLALQNEYATSKEKYNKLAVENLKSSKIPNVIAANPLDRLDFGSKDFVEGINSLAKILKVIPHPNALLTLEACQKVIEKRLNPQALQNPSNYILKGTPFPIEKADLGFDLGDPVLNRAAKLLRLLYIHDLRNLQTRANEAIVAVQTVTANPKTDTKLGKVGK